MRNTPDAIVYTQEEFVDAANAGCKNILVCDCVIECDIPCDIQVYAIGNAVIKSHQEIPKEICTNDDSLPEIKANNLKSQDCTSYKKNTSYKSSYRTSYRGSYNTSYRTSYRGSYNTSYRPSSYKRGSFVGGSFKRGTSFHAHIRKLPFPTHFEGPYSDLLDELFKEISMSDIGGYGIDLI